MVRSLGKLVISLLIFVDIVMFNPIMAWTQVQNQIIIAVPSAQTVAPNATVSIDVFYETNPSATQTTALNLRIHYNSSQLILQDQNTGGMVNNEGVLVDLQNVFQDSLSIFPDTIDSDSTGSGGDDLDSATDLGVFAGWLNQSGRWPSTTSFNATTPRIKLYTITFTTSANFTGTTVRFTSSGSTIPLTAQPVTINSSVPRPDNPPTASPQTPTTPEDTPLNITLTGSDLDNDPLTFSIVPNQGPNRGTLSGTPPNVTYTPNANFNGTDSFMFVANDGTVNSTPATVTITVTPVNDRPVANAQSITTPEDTPLNIILTGSDVDGEDTLTFSIVAQPTRGVLSGTPPNVIYTPNTNFNGTDSFTFKVTDNAPQPLDSVAVTVTITVSGRNDNPIATAQSVTTPEDTPLNITLTGSDLDNDPLTFSIVPNQGPNRGMLSGKPPNVTYTPNANFNGTDSFMFVANDGTVNSAPATVAITVTAVNDPPVANAQSVTTSEDTPLNIILTGSDVDGDTLTFSIVTQPTRGVLSGTPPNVIYTPNANLFGMDSFTFMVNDGTVNSPLTTVTIDVTPVPDPTLPVADAQAVSTPEDTALHITLTGSDPDGDALTFHIVTPPTSGTLSSISVINSTSAAVTYTPNANFNGTDSFSFVTNDGATDSLQAATVTITVPPVPDAPTATAQAVTTSEDAAGSNITLTGNDVDGNPLTFRIVTQPTRGTLSGTPPNVRYTPNANVNGTDAFAFVANDGAADSASVTVTLNIAAVNDPPTATAQTVTTPEDTLVNIILTGSDIDGNPLTFRIVTQPTRGTLSGTPPNVRYTPNANVNGTDTFTFVANDGTVDSVAATVTINVTAVNDVPLANTRTITTSEDTPVAITLSGSDAEGSSLTFRIVRQPTNGTLSNTPPDVIYSPNVNFSGTDSFTFVANDGSVDSAEATVTVNITPVDELTITTPEEGHIVAGRGVTVAATAEMPSNVTSVRFQFRAVGAATFTTIQDVTIPPFLAPWDTTVLTDGAYELQAVATVSSGTPLTSQVVRVTVDNVAPAIPPDIVENCGSKEQGVEANVDNLITTCQGITITIPAGALNGNDRLTIGVLSSSDIPAPTRLPGDLVVGTAINITLGSGQSTFSLPLTITVPYPDTDQNGFVDNTNPPINETALTLWFFNTSTQTWTLIPNPQVDAIANVIVGQVDHLTTFATFQAQSDTAPGPGTTSTTPTTPTTPVASASGGGGGCSLVPANALTSSYLLAALGNIFLPLVVMAAMWAWRRRPRR